jgi:hypothetical protein
MGSPASLSCARRAHRGDISRKLFFSGKRRCKNLGFCTNQKARFDWSCDATFDIFPLARCGIELLTKKLNLDEKRARKAGELATFVRQYGRKAQRGVEPNDRRFDKHVLNAVKRMPPDQLDRLLREDEDL